MPTYFDEVSPRGPVPADSERGRVVGLYDALQGTPQGARSASAPGTLADVILPDPKENAAAVSYAQTAPHAMLYGRNPTPPKFADEYLLWQAGLITFAPVPGLEAQLGSVTAAYTPYATKLPQQRGAPPNRSQIAAAQANTPQDPLSSNVTDMLALLVGA